MAISASSRGESDHGWLTTLLAVIVFLLPWQARWIVDVPQVNGGAWEYGVTSVYATEVLLWAVLAIGYLRLLRQGVRWRRFQLNWREPKTWIVASAYLLVAVATLSLLWAADRGVGVRAWFRLVEGSVLFFLLATAPVRWLALARAGALAAAVQGVVAVEQFFVQSVPASTWLGMAAQSADRLGASVVELSDGRWLRAYGTFPHPNILAGFLAVGLLLAAAWYVARYQYLDRVAALACGALAAVGLVLTFSRTGMAATGLGLLTALLVASRGSARWPLARFVSFTALVLAAAAALVLPQALTRATGAGRLELRSLQERADLAHQACLLAGQRWLGGVGIGNATVATQRLDPGQPGWAYQPAHDVWLAVTVELGVLGALALAGLVVSLAWRASAQRAWVGVGLLAALAVAASFDHYVWTLYPGIMLWWVGLGLAARLGKQEAGSME